MEERKQPGAYFGSHLPRIKVFEVRIIMRFLNASEKFSIIARLNHQWHDVVYSGLSWDNFLYTSDPTWKEDYVSRFLSQFIKDMADFRHQLYISINFDILFELTEKFAHVDELFLEIPSSYIKMGSISSNAEKYQEEYEKVRSLKIEGRHIQKIGSILILFPNLQVLQMENIDFKPHPSLKLKELYLDFSETYHFTFPNLTECRDLKVLKISFDKTVPPSWNIPEHLESLFLFNTNSKLLPLSYELLQKCKYLKHLSLLNINIGSSLSLEHFPHLSEFTYRHELNQVHDHFNLQLHPRKVPFECYFQLYFNKTSCLFSSIPDDTILSFQKTVSLTETILIPKLAPLIKQAELNVKYLQRPRSYKIEESKAQSFPHLTELTVYDQRSLFSFRNLQFQFPRLERLRIYNLVMQPQLEIIHPFLKELTLDLDEQKLDAPTTFSFLKKQVMVKTLDLLKLPHLKKLNLLYISKKHLTVKLNVPVLKSMQIGYFEGVVSIENKRPFSIEKLEIEQFVGVPPNLHFICKFVKRLVLRNFKNCSILAKLENCRLRSLELTTVFLEKGLYEIKTIGLVMSYCPVLERFIVRSESELKVEKEIVVEHPFLKIFSYRCTLSQKGHIASLTLLAENLEVCELGCVNVVKLRKRGQVIVRKIGSVVGQIINEE